VSAARLPKRNQMNVLNTRPIRALLAAQVISVTGAQMTWLALPWFVLTTSGSATRTSVVMAAEAVGLAAFGIQSGNLVNRLGARRTMLLCDTLRAPTVAVVPILHWTGALSFPVLIAVAAGIGVFSAPYFAAQKVIVPEILGEDERVVTKMQTLSQSASRITMLLGPVTAGVLIGFIGAPSVLMVDAATYAVAVALVAGFVPSGRRAPLPGEERGSRAGIRFVLGDPLLRWWMPVFTIGDAAWMAIFVALPVLTVQRYDSDPRIAGWLFASFGVGAIVGNIAAFRLLDRTDGLRLVGIGILGQALPLWLLVVELPASLVSASLMLSGLANGIVNPSIHAILTLRAPPALRANVMAVVMTLFAVVTPIGLLGAGPLLDAFGLQLVFGLCAAIQTVTMTGAAIAAFRARAATELRLQRGSPSRTALQTRPAKSRLRPKRRATR
jgi:MFS family permease